MPPLVSARRELGQNIFIVAFDVTETENGYEYYTAELSLGGVWRRDLIISAIIRTKYSTDEMEAIAMNVLADFTNRDARNEHRAMQQWRQKAKQWATELMQWAQEHGIAEVELEPMPEHEAPDETIESGDSIGTLSAAIILAREDAAELEDDKAVEVPELFPLWADQIGKQVKAGERYTYRLHLYKVLQDHTVQAEWTPDVTPALFTEVVVQGEGEAEIGTLDNPIPYNGNMELEEGKYYSQDGVTYLCIRSTGTPVYHPLAQLVGLYVEVVEQS